MRILPFKIPKPEQSALVYQEDHEYLFYDKFHQHEEIQISYIATGEGTIIVGDTISDYTEGDVLVLGSNLPHVFKSDPNFNNKSLMISLFFNYDSFGNTFFNLEELQELKPFFKKAFNGFKITNTSQKTRALFASLKSAKKLEQFITFLEILKATSKAKHKLLSTYIYEKQYTDIEGKRMRDVLEYTTTNFYKNITLEDIAEVAAMTKNAFCKYFKKRTNKTYFKFLNEIRIEHASKLLLKDNEYTIAEIAEQSGFNNISNFNRQFKTIKLLSPKQFKKQAL